MPRTRHTQAWVFHKNNHPKLVLFYLKPLEIVDQDREPSEKLGYQIKEQVSPDHEDQVVLVPDQVLVLRTRSWSGSPKHTLRSVKEVTGQL